MRRVLATFALVCFSLIIVAASQAGCMGKEKGMEHGPFRPDCKMAQALAPTPEQQSQWTEMRREFRKEILPLCNHLFSRRAELSALLSNPEAESQAIREKHGEVVALEGRIQEKVMDHRLAFRQTLNPEQLSTWIAIKMACPGCHQGMGLGRAGCPGGGMDPGMDMPRRCRNW